MLNVFKKYINNRIELLKLELTETISGLLGILIFIFAVLTFGIMFLFLFSFAIGLLIGYWVNNLGLGVLIFSGVYLLTFIILIMNYKGIRKYIQRKIIEIQLNNNDDEEDDDKD